MPKTSKKVSAGTSKCIFYFLPCVSLSCRPFSAVSHLRSILRPGRSIIIRKAFNDFVNSNPLPHRRPTSGSFGGGGEGGGGQGRGGGGGGEAGCTSSILSRTQGGSRMFRPHASFSRGHGCFCSCDPPAPSIHQLAINV